MSRHQIDYESLAQEAMRGLVRTVLQRVAKSGLPGDHHFYISFHTRGAGVAVSRRLLERYPDEMTIVLQNKFSDLKAFDDRFEVTLWFDSIPERLLIPFTAIKVFFDPSVPFGHQFEAAEPQSGPAVHASVTSADRRSDERPAPVTSMTSSPSPRSRQGGRSETSKPPAPMAKGAAPLQMKPVSPPPAPSSGATGGAPVTVQPRVAKSPASKPSVSSPTESNSQPTPRGSEESRPGARTAGSPAKAEPPAPAAPAEQNPPEMPSKVVALDAFRKKN